METTRDECSWEEIMGKDLKMRRLVNGSGDIAEMGTTITCNMKGYLVFDEKVQQHHFEEWKNQKFKIGESDAIPGVEMALRFSRVGDLIRVRCQSRFCYGPAGRPPVVVGGSTDQPDNGEAGRTISAIPPDTDLEYELEIAAHLREGSIDPDLMDVAKKTFERLGATNHDAEMPVKLQERLLALTELQQRKEAGNRWFSYGDFTRAARAYSKATQIADRYFNGNANTGNSNARALEGLNIKDGVESSVAAAEAALAQAEKEKEQQRRIFEAGDEEVVSVYVSCLNNMAACQLKLGENAKAKDICVRVLEMDPTNHKALLRAAKAALATHSYEECDMCLQRLLAVAIPGSSAALAAAAEKKRLKQAQLDYKQQTRQMSSNMAKQLFKNSKGRGGSDNVGAGDANDGAAGSKSYSEVNSGSDCININSSSSSSIGSGRGRDRAQSDGGNDAAKHTTATNSTSATAATATASLATAVAPAVPDQQQQQKVKPSAAASSADRGLLLLLVTSLVVLLVSVAMVVWSSGKKVGDDV